MRVKDKTFARKAVASCRYLHHMVTNQNRLRCDDLYGA
jgi:hypothetical protein